MTRTRGRRRLRSASVRATATPTATLTPSASPTAPAPGCGAPRPFERAPLVELDVEEIVPNQQVTVTVRGVPGRRVLLHAYSRPSTTYRVVRTGELVSTTDGGIAQFFVFPGTNTRLYASYDGVAESDSASVVVDVRTALSLSTVRTGPRAYVLQGRVLPRRGGQLVTVYRRSGGNEVITVQARTDASGTYRVARTFGSAGRLVLLARTGRTLTNVPGQTVQDVVLVVR